MIEITAKKEYGNVTVLDVTRVAFEEGRIYAIIGANGSGKTTLLKIIGGQLRFEGEKKLDGDPIIGYMPQSSYPFSMSVKRNILLPTRLPARSKSLYRVHYLAGVLGLTKLLGKNATKLSGGETQRMALACVLMTKADILLLDEPTSNMDIEQTKAVMQLLKSHIDTYKCTLIFATHSLKQAEMLADEVIFLKNGLLVERGKPQIILHEPEALELKEFISFNS